MSDLLKAVLGSAILGVSATAIAADTVDVISLNGIWAESESLPMMARDNEGCTWLITVNMNSQISSVVGKAKQKTCGTSTTNVSGELANENGQIGLIVDECVDAKKNNEGDFSCHAGKLSAGHRAKIIVSK